MQNFLVHTHNIVEIESYQDMAERAAFVECLSASEIEIEQALGKYHFRDKTPCGLKGCRTPHNKGYLIRTKQGQETNIGNVCGKKYLHQTWHEATKSLDRAIDRKRYLETLSQLLERRSEVESHLHQLEHDEYGASWVERNKRALRNYVDSSICSALIQRANRGDGVVHTIRRRTAEEIAVDEAAGLKAPRYENVRAGSLKGLEIWQSRSGYPTSAGSLIKRVRAVFEDIDASALPTASNRELSTWAKSANELDTKLHDLSSYVGDGRAFFRPENVSLVPLLALDPDARKDAENAIAREWALDVA